MSTLLGAIQDLLFPPLCLGCGRWLDDAEPPLFCPDCLSLLVFLGPPLCPCCGIPYATGTDHLCGPCLLQTYSFDQARSLLSYLPPISTVILNLKFGGRLDALATIGALTAQSACLDDLNKPDYIVPVPLHDQRLRHRGYNQATLLARECFPQWRTKIRLDFLIRTRPTTPQSQLSGQERRINLNKVFAVRKDADLHSKRILLVDDVLTTGSTINECAKILRKAGAERIEVFTVARSLGPGQQRIPQIPRDY